MRRTAKWLGLVAAALLLVAAGAFVAVPRISSALIVRPIDQPVATGAFACADLDGGPTIPVVDANGNSPRQAVSSDIVALQTGVLPGFERVIVYFGGAVPHYAVGRVRPPIFSRWAQTGDTDVRLRGEYGLQVVVTWASVETVDGSVHPTGPTIVDGRVWDPGDQIALLGLGLSRDAPFRASTFQDPSRLVIDVTPGAPACPTR